MKKLIPIIFSLLGCVLPIHRENFISGYVCGYRGKPESLCSYGFKVKINKFPALKKKWESEGYVVGGVTRCEEDDVVMYGDTNPESCYK